MPVSISTVKSGDSLESHQLAKAPHDIRLGDLIRSIDGPLAPIRCASLTAYRACADCPDPEACAIRVLMTDVRNAISDVLDRRTLRDQIELEALRGEVAA